MQCHQCNHFKNQLNSVKRSTRSTSDIAALFATAAASVAGNSPPEWVTEQSDQFESAETVQARIEYIKQQILRLLGLINVPHVTRHIDANCKCIQ